MGEVHRSSISWRKAGPLNHNDFHGEVRNFIQAGTVVQEAARPDPPWELCFNPYMWTDRTEKLELLTAHHRCGRGEIGDAAPMRFGSCSNDH